MKRTLLPILLTLLLVTAGCHTQRKAAEATQPEAATTEASPDTTPIIPPHVVPTPQYRSANFTCSAQGMTANGQLRMLEDSVIWACATKIVELGRARLTPDSVVVYAKVMNRCFRGTYTDIYRRFHYRTSFDELHKIIIADDADKQIAELLKSLKVDADVHVGPWKKADALTFPIPIPSNVKPL